MKKTIIGLLMAIVLCIWCTSVFAECQYVMDDVTGEMILVCVDDDVIYFPFGR